MSRPKVIVSAVHELDCAPEEWWREHRDSLDGFEKSEYGDEVEWRMCEGTFKSSAKRESYSVEMWYHSGRDADVVEIVLAGDGDMQEIQHTGLESVIEEINFRFDVEFTLEAYYWYTGVDRPGGVKRGGSE